jgi:hypothetical protein|tara:strand:- start:1053 stop:1796 length:744 start_codon:yes stop_codon:yes gene_type:complete
MPDNNMLLMLGLGAAALFFLRNQGTSEVDQTPQLAGAAMMAAGEGTAPDAPFQIYSPPANPVFFFNQGGEMAQVPENKVPVKSTTDEDIGTYPGGVNQPELEFTVARSVPSPSTTDISPINPVFSGSPQGEVVASTIWDQQAEIASSNFLPLLAIRDTAGSGIEILGQASSNISNLSSKEQFRAVNVDTGFGFTTTAEVLGEYVQGFTGDGSLSGMPPIDNAVVVSQTQYDTSIPAWAGGNNWWDEG